MDQSIRLMYDTMTKTFWHLISSRILPSKSRLLNHHSSLSKEFIYQSVMSKISPWFEKVKSSQTLTLGAVAMIVGLLTGAGVWIFKGLIELFHDFMFGTLQSVFSPLGAWTVMLIPVIGGVVVGLVVHYMIGEEKLHGTAAIMQSVALAGGRLRYQRMPVKTAAAILSIGSGASVGPEDPSVQIGSNLGAMLGQWLRFSDERMRTVVAAGAASAIAAAFNAPIAGVFFAFEIVLGEISGGAPGLVLIAAVISSAFTQAVSGSAPAFSVPAYGMNSVWELPLYLVLGLFLGPISAFYVRLLYLFQDLYHSWAVPGWVKTASAGLAVGLVGIFLPQIFGVGYGTIEEILNKNDFTFSFLIALMIFKLLLTTISIGGGFVGGVFAPALFIGASAGGAFGLLAARIFPGLGINPEAFALVGMAALLAGAVHAPLTAIILLFEMSNDYHMILPLMFGVAVSLLLSQRLQKDSVYMMGLARHGIRLVRGRDVEVLDSIPVGEIMRTDVTPLPESTPLTDAANILAQTRHHGLPIVNRQGELVGILTVTDIDRAVEQDRLTVAEACTQKVITTTPDQSLSAALRRMSAMGVGRLPVVDPENPRRLVGWLGRADVIRAYDVALTRRTTQRHQEHAVRLDAITPASVEVADIVVEKNSLMAGRKIGEIAFPSDCVVASIRRKSDVFIPHGQTVIEAGDILVIVARGAARARVFDMCQERETVDGMNNS
jgi:chloride channel protein, CIC family